jgi:hypothetical protein
MPKVLQVDPSAGRLSAQRKRAEFAKPQVAGQTFKEFSLVVVQQKSCDNCSSLLKKNTLDKRAWEWLAASYL